MVEVKGKKYEILEVFKKSQFPQQDMILCISEHGYKECFHRFDLYRQDVDGRKKIYNWTESEKQALRDELEKGKTPTEVGRAVSSDLRSERAIISMAWKLKMEMEKCEDGKTSHVPI